MVPRAVLLAVVLGVLLAVMTALTVVSLVTLPYYAHAQGLTLLFYTIALWVLFGLGFLLLRRMKGRAVVVVILVGAVALGGAAMSGPPNTSTDSARYAWDGIVQNAGISPYKYIPISSHLKQLRPAWLFPTPVEGPDDKRICPGERIQIFRNHATHELVCTAMNRGHVRTIYPPSSELLFAAIRFVVGANATYWPMQLAGLLMSLGITVLLLRFLRKREMDVRWAALWAWCPLVANEAITNSHVDTLGAILLLVATLAISGGRRWLGGIALGAAIAAKLIPVIGVPAIIRKQPWKITIAAIATFLLLYVPYILSSGVKVLGYLPGYLTEEGYGDGKRFALITTFAHGPWAIGVAAILLVAVAVLVWRKTSLTSPWLGQTVMIGLTLLILSPRYPWYALLLVPMVAMCGRWEWLAIGLALEIRTLEPFIAVTRNAELAALVVIIVASIVRSGPGWIGRAWLELRHPFRVPQPEYRV